MRLDGPLSAAVLLASQIYASSGNVARARNLAQDVMEATAGGPHVSEEEMESIRLRARELLEKLPDAEPADAAKFDEAMPAAPTTVPVRGVASWSSMGFKASVHGDILGVAPGLGWAVFKLPTGNEIIVWNFHVNKLQHRVTGIATGTTRFFELPSKLPRVKEVPIYILLCQYDERKYNQGADCRPLMLNSLLDHPRGGTSSFADLSGTDCMRCALSSGLTLQQGMERLEARTLQLCLGPDRSYMTYAIQGSHSTGWTLASAAKYARSFDRCKITIGRSRAQSARGPFSFDAQAALGVLHLTAGVSSLSFTTENVLASGGHDGVIKIWDCCALSCIVTLESDFVRLPWEQRCPDVTHMAWSPNCGTSGALLAVVNEAEYQPRSLVLKCWRYREDSLRCQTLHLLHPDEGYSERVDKMILHESHLIVVLNRCIKTFAIESSGELCPQAALPYTDSQSSGRFATHGGFFFFASASGLVAWSLRSLGGGGDDDDDAAPKPWPKKAKRLNCAACGRYDPAKNQICEGCKAVHFCDRACQKAGWKTHKPLCVEIREKKEKKRGT